MGELTKLPNIGPELERQLSAVGITSFDQLREAGSGEAWLRIRRMDPSACYNRLLSLEGAVRLMSKNQLPQEVKAQLKAFYTDHKLPTADGEEESK